MSQTLKRNVVLAGGHLVARQLLGMVIAVVGMSLLARLIGPHQYGVFVTDSVSVLYAYFVFELGLGTYLMRFGRDNTEAIEQQAFTLLLGLSAAATGLLAFLTLVIGLFDDASRWIMVPFMVGIPLQLMSVVPLAKLERELDYQTVVLIELAGHIVFYGVALPAALLRSADASAPAFGWLAQQILVSLLLFSRSRFRARLRWQPALARDMLRYGLGVSASEWVLQLRRLINPWVVGYFAGPAAVGVVALTIRFIDALTFIRACVGRMSVPVMGRIGIDRQRLLNVVNEGSLLSLLGVGVCLVAFALGGKQVIDLLVGSKWDGVFEIFPYLAIATLLHCVFGLHISALHVLRRNTEAAIANMAFTFLLTTAALVLIPRFGPVGYGLAELAALPSYLLLDAYLTRELHYRPDYGIALLWTACFAAGVFWPRAIAVPAIVLVACYPRLWRLLTSTTQGLRVSRSAWR